MHVKTKCLEYIYSNQEDLQSGILNRMEQRRRSSAKQVLSTIERTCPP